MLPSIFHFLERKLKSARHYLFDHKSSIGSHSNYFQVMKVIEARSHILFDGEVIIKSKSLINDFEVVEAAAGGSYHTSVALLIR